MILDYKQYHSFVDTRDQQKTATTPLASEFLAGQYHVVWTFCNGQRRTLDWQSDTPLAEWNILFTHAEGQDEHHFDVALHFGSLDIEWTLEHQKKTVNVLKMAHNNNPGEGAVEDDAVVTFSDLRDEQGYPYLRCNFATNEHDPDGEMVNMEFVAKRTDIEGIQQLGLTKNEKLRLGYPVWDDGTFEPEDMNKEVNSMNPDSLQKQLQVHIEASVKIHAKLCTIQNNINKQVTNATNGMHQAMQQAWRSVSNPAQNIVPSYERGKSTSPPPAKRRKHATAGAEDPDPASPFHRRKKSGLESTPISMELDSPRGSGPLKRKRGAMLGGSGRGGKRKMVRAST